MTRWYTPAEVLKMATADNAELLALSDRRNPYPGKLGVIEEGALADLLLVDGDPIADIALLADPSNKLLVIMKNGQIFKTNCSPHKLLSVIAMASHGYIVEISAPNLSFTIRVFLGYIDNVRLVLGPRIVAFGRAKILMHSQEWLIIRILEKEMLPDFRFKRMKLSFGSCSPGR